MAFFSRFIAVGAVLTATSLWAQTSATTLATSPSALFFNYQLGGVSLPASQNLQVTTQPSGQNFTVSVAGSSFNAAWLLVSASQGKAPVTLKVQVNPTGLPAVAYNATIRQPAAAL